MMIRSIKSSDMHELLALLEATKLFESNDIEELAKMLDLHFNNATDSQDVWLTDDDNGLVGVAYVAPERMAEGAWNLYLIAIHPDYQRQGRGASLLRYVEQMLIKRNQRLLLVETSGLDEFEYVRTFYRQNGYKEEARIREFYKAGEDKVIFRKMLRKDA
jgi:ribosomal protein S18 acetylase RimI-like enzyme